MISNPRYEIKFVLDIAAVSRAESWLYCHTSARKIYENRTVNSLYFDDPGFSAVRDNLAGVSERRKVRLRWYSGGGDEQDKNAKLEIKYRQGRLGGKETLPLPVHWEEALDHLEYKDIYPSIQKDLCGQVALPQDSAFFPTLHVSYERRYFEDAHGIRITLDENIRFGNPIPHMALVQNPLKNYAPYVMEIKFPTDKKTDVASYLRKLNMTPRRHSKYLAGLAVFGYVNYI